MAESLSQTQIREFKDAFDLFDQDKDEKISREDLEKTLLLVGVKKSPGEVKDMMNECDPGRTGNISFPQFLSVLSAKLRDTSPEEDLRAAFKSFDPEGTGMIASSELKGQLRSFGNPLTETEWKLMLKEIGASESGLFDYNKFIDAVFMKN